MSNPKKIIVATAHIQCPMCPTTIIGNTATGLTVYARYRWGCLSVRVDPRDPAPHGGAWGLIIYEAQLGESDDGVMEYEELRNHTQNVVEWPDQHSPRPTDGNDELAD